MLREIEESQELANVRPYNLNRFDRIEALQKFLDEHDKDEAVALLYDDDADGLSAGIAMHQTLTKLGFKHISTCPKARDRGTFSGDFLTNLESAGVQTIFCVDFEPISWRMSTPLKLQNFAFNLVIIDHHFDQTEEFEMISQVASGQADSKFITFIHPNNSSDSDAPSQYCCAKFVYDVCNCFVDLSSQEWKTIVGMIGDMNVIKWGEYISLIAKKYDVDISTDEKLSFFRNDFGRIADLIGYAASQDSDQVETLFESYLNADQVSDLFKFEKDYMAIKAEYWHWFLHWKDNATYDADHNLYFVPIVAKNLLTSMVSSTISYVNDEYAFCFYQHNGEKSYHISMRAQKGHVHMGTLLKAVSSKFKNSNGGGHIPAAGGICQEKDLNNFLQRIKDSFNKHLITKE